MIVTCHCFFHPAKKLRSGAIVRFSDNSSFSHPGKKLRSGAIIRSSDNSSFNSVLRPFQDYFSSYETGQSVGGRKRENPEKNHLAHPQTELGLSHMWPERGSNPHQTQR